MLVTFFFLHDLRVLMVTVSLVANGRFSSSTLLSPPAAHPRASSGDQIPSPKHHLPLIPSSPPLPPAPAAVAAAPGTERF
jgi:hypothetical protein